MKHLATLVALAAAFTVTASIAEAAPSALAKACAKDIKSVCADVKPGGGKLKTCVKEHFPTCRPTVRSRSSRRRRSGRACKADAKKLCSDVKPGKGRLAECLQSHAADVSDACKDSMAKAEAGNK